MSVADSVSAPLPAYSRVCDVFEPVAKLTLSFEGTVITEGSTQTPIAVSVLPTVGIEDAPAGTLYTLILSDPDAPSVADPKFGEWQHWVVINAPEGKVEDGETLTAFFGSAPGKDTGAHRYCFVAYAQPGKIEADEARVPLASGFPARRSFNSRAFAEKYALKAAAAVTYLCEWSEDCAELSKKVAPPAN